MQFDQETIQLICSHDVISFDIFDTIALRPFLQPRDLWHYIEEKHGFKDFYQHRAKCDVGEYASIDEQYMNMPKELQTAKELECKLEVELSTTNMYVKQIYDIAKQHNKTIVVASDMYLSIDIIRKILSKHGIAYDKLYLSNEVKACKSNGTMFQLIKEDYPNLKILHIGDNQNSDIYMAKLNGIDAIKVENVCKKTFAENPFLAHFLNKHNAIEDRIFIACLAIAASNFEANITLSSCWTKLGEIVGSTVAVLLLQFIADYVEQHNIQNVLFVGRDGYALKDLFDALQLNAKSHYIYSIRSNTSKLQKDEYTNYIKNLNIANEKNVVVDLTTQKFSAQKNISEALGKSIDEIAFIATNGNDASKSVMIVNNGLFWLCMLVECLFRSPEFPIVSIDKCKPTYKYDFNMFELFFIELANWMSYIYKTCAIKTYNVLKQLDIKLNGQNYVDFLMLHAACLTDIEKQYFKTVKHLSDGQVVHMFPIQLLNNKT